MGVYYYNAVARRGNHRQSVEAASAILSDS